MTTMLAKFTTMTEGRAARRRSVVRRMVISKAKFEDAIEDAQLNAIADERADGPFISVSLDDL